MTGAFAAFASGGLKADPYSVLKILNPKGEVLYERGSVERERVIVQETAETMNAMLYRVVEAGTGQRARIAEHEIAGKTGTSSDWRDAWFVGYTSQLVTGVWVGNDDFTPMRRVTGGSLPAQIWNDYMREALKPFTPEPLKRTLPRPEQLYADNNGRDFLTENQVSLNIFRGANERSERGAYQRAYPLTPYGMRVPPFAQQRAMPRERRNAAPEYNPRRRSQSSRRGNAFQQRNDRATVPPQPGNNPYEQEWYLREQAARNGYAYYGAPNEQTPPNENPYVQYPPRKTPNVWRPRGRAPDENTPQRNPRIADTPNGRVYSMEPVGR